VKILFYDQNGMCLFYKRLDQGRFTWPSTQPSPDGTASITLTPVQLGLPGDWGLGRPGGIFAFNL